MLCARKVWLCKDGATLWPAETTPLVGLYHLLFGTGIFSMKVGQNVLNDIFS